MQFKIKKHVLLGLLTKAVMVLGTSDIKPILRNFNCIVEEPNTIRIVATDLDLSVVAKTDLVEVTGKGQIVVDGTRLLELVRAAADDTMIFNIDDKNVDISCARSKWKMKLVDPTDYPEIPEVDAANTSAVDRKQLLHALQKVSVAAPRTTYRPEIFMVNINKGKVQASDTIRLHQAYIDSDCSVQIPRMAVDNLIWFLRESDSDGILIAETGNHLMFVIDNDVFIATKLTETFPDVERALLTPLLEQNDKVLTIDKKQLIDGIKRVRLMADPDINLVVLNLSKDSLVLTAKDTFGNSATSEIDAGWISGDRKLGANWEYLIEALEAYDSNEVLIKLGEKGPMLFEEEGFVAVVNLLRI